MIIDSPMATIKDVLIEAPNLLWSNSLFLPDTSKWKQEIKGIIWDCTDVQSNEVPKIAEEKGLHCSIGIQDIQQIADNVRQQFRNCSVEQSFKAFLYH
ncbi:MAG TPA: hypothetical protein H9667_00390 [Firmicutes bacterium]|nr:hypothetical protein [Bacillales bacterium]HJA39975.1 hypothetical protein [Bacillota bacterium]